MTLLYLQNHYDVEEIDLGYQFVTQMGSNILSNFYFISDCFRFLIYKDLYVQYFFSANHYNKAFLEQEFLKLVEINFYS